MNRNTHAIAGAALLVLSACSTTAVQSAHDQFVTAESAASVAETLAAAYVDLPLCPAKSVCADREVLVKIAGAKQGLDVAIAQGRKVFADLAATLAAQTQALAIVQSALAGLQAINALPSVQSAVAGKGN